MQPVGNEMGGKYGTGKNVRIILK